MRALVVGYGRMGGFHAKVLRDLGHEVVTVDPDPSRRADFIRLPNALERVERWPMDETQRYDVAVAACPADRLVDTAYRLAGIPKLLVEKPFATNVRDARLLAAYLRQCKSSVCVGLVERFNPQVRALRAHMNDGTLRDVTSIKFTRLSVRPSPDVATDLRLHDVDLALYLRAYRQDREVAFETDARCPRKVRTIEVTHAEGTTTYDLCAHDLSPLHGLWHAFLTDAPYPTPDDAILALDFLPHTLKREATAVAA